jgi:PEGA domain
MVVRNRRAAVVAIVVAFFAFAIPPAARADDDPKVAREEFVRGAQLVKDADWAGALAAFETSARLKTHPVTTYNIGACLRAMGQYTRARKSFAAALEESGKTPGLDLSPGLAEETRRYVADLDKLLATLDLTITPDEALIAIDGRPLEPAGAALSATRGGTTLMAGTLAMGPPKAAPKGRFRVVVDPGTHVITISRPGFADAVDKQTLGPGATLERKLELDRLPAQIRVTSNLVGAQVLVNEADVGLTPLEISRPAGKYHVVVKKPGFLVFDTSTNADPGQNLNVTATLREDKPALTQRWWFWTGVGVVVVGAAVTTYALTRPDPERPALNGGGLGWSARSP